MSIQDDINNSGETLKGSWTINCIPFGGGRLLGKLYISDKSIYYDAQYDMSLGGIVEQITTSAIAAAGHPLLVTKEICDQWKSKGFLHISKEQIDRVEEQSSFFKKKLILHLKDSQSVIFDYGMMSVKKLKAALEE